MEEVGKKEKGKKTGSVLSSLGILGSSISASYEKIQPLVDMTPPRKESIIGSEASFKGKIISTENL